MEFQQFLSQQIIMHFLMLHLKLNQQWISFQLFYLINHFYLIMINKQYFS
jgi:hypothetical protein